IKTALALYHRVIPPTLNADTPHPDLGLDQTCFSLANRVTPWLNHRSNQPRRAGVNAFGFGGINAHAIFEEHPVSEATLPRYEREWVAEVVVVSATDRDALRTRAADLAAWLEQLETQRGDATLLDVAAAAAAEGGAERLSVVASSKSDL